MFNKIVSWLLLICGLIATGSISAMSSADPYSVLSNRNFMSLAPAVILERIGGSIETNGSMLIPEEYIILYMISRFGYAKTVQLLSHMHSQYQCAVDLMTGHCKEAGITQVENQQQVVKAAMRKVVSEWADWQLAEADSRAKAEMLTS